ncbi:MAG: cephalosporin hydroxylase [Acidobacteria bacterium RIFCSPLOWO2_02_FULL_59_13]|nr:MAG: cephalosporin hydroxylase [Acidobacteria bacterium RIFCSPLOWO2_02_FULL_59_13]OGA68043.1 MAG: cephalosporin hydroxylase [Betaproteobacteria bacterium RIFCSPLOWO2_12_FULL_65_14]
MSSYEEFKQECRAEIAALGADGALQKATREWMDRANGLKYSYHFEWMGRPIIQYPQDIVAVQELIWTVRPDLIIETGVAHGGSLIMSASMLALLDLCDAIESRATMNPVTSNRKVVGVDIEIRAHSRKAIQSHPMSSRIQMVEGSSIDARVLSEVTQAAKGHDRVLVFLDSMHTHAHVFAELEAYAPLVSAGSYCVVFDTVIDDMPADSFPDRPWGPGNNPKTAVREFLARHNNFEVDHEFDDKLLITVAPGGFLKRLS